MTSANPAGPLRIGFFGGGAQALECLDRMIASEHCNIRFLHLRGEDDDALRARCVADRIEILEDRNVNAPETLERIRSHETDLLVSVNAKQIFRSELLSIPRLGALNVHNGMLPRQRGGGGAYTAIINGETPGTTVHFIDEGIDTGDILAQREIPLSETETMGDFQRKAISVSAGLLLGAVTSIRNGTAVRTPQRDKPFHYTPRKAPWDELVDWTQSSRLILDKIRARKPGPANFYLYRDERIEIVEAQAEPKLLDYVNTPGQVLQRDAVRGVLVKTGDNGIWLSRVRRPDNDTETVPDHPPGALLRYVLDREVSELRSRVAALEQLLDNRE